LEGIKHVACSETLRTKIEGNIYFLKIEIMKKKSLIFQRQMIDFNEFFSSFVKCKEVIRKEKIYNIYTNFDTVINIF
jgi:hypothetical protein